jgi:predicted glycosyltransferase
MNGASTTDGRQKRAIFFVFDGGTGLGHLRRLSCIARALQGRFSCLIVTGHRAAANWFVPAECEYVHIPAWDSLLEEKAGYWGRDPFLRVDRQAAIRFRKDLLRGIVDAFAPDVIFVDHLPLGMLDELEDIIATADCRKYLVTRGVQNETEDLPRLLFGGKARLSIERHYDRVLVAMDPRIFDFSQSYRELDTISEKIVHTGYVVDPIDRDAIAARRRARGLKPDTIWVVASAGGGQHGEALIEGCCALARSHDDIAFDIVIGPRSSLSRAGAQGSIPEGRDVRLHGEVSDLHHMHGGADIVICSGGYNSLVESLQGNAKIICVPSRKNERDEQYLHAALLKTFVDMELNIDVGHLPAMFERTVRAVRDGQIFDLRGELNLGGIDNIRDIVFSDTESAA